MKTAATLMIATTAILASHPVGAAEKAKQARAGDPSGTGRTCPGPTTAADLQLPDGTMVKMITADCLEAGTAPRKN